jgi:hypothetical protein
MLQLLVRVVSNVGALLGGVAALATINLPKLVVVLAWILIVLSAIAVWWDVVDHLKRRPKIYPPKGPGIVDYLAEWLASGGRAAVFSRDLSWANDPRVADVLHRKAKAGELLAIVARVTPEIAQLAKDGAEMFEHRAAQISLRSRFTVIDYGKMGSRLAIGVVEEGRHVIREYGPGDHVVMSLAADLLELAKHTARKVI